MRVQKTFTKKTAPLFDELLNYLQPVWHAKKCRVACKKGLNCAFKVKVTLRTDFFLKGRGWGGGGAEKKVLIISQELCIGSVFTRTKPISSNPK